MNNRWKEQNYSDLTFYKMNRKNIPGIIFLFSLSFIIFSCQTLLETDQLKEGFINPPDSARPGVYWYFMDGNLDREC